MTDVRDATESLLAERPDLESDVRNLLAVDDDRDTWTFDDVPVESGPFGELVAAGLVERQGDEYRIADPVAVRTVLEDERPDATGDGHAVELPALTAPDVDWRTAAALAATLAVLVAFRVVPFRSVFRGPDVLFTGNDPYRYRYWVEQLLAASSGPLDLTLLADLPGAVETDETLVLVTLWFASELAGGTAAAAAAVMAWYPVVAALVSGVLVYLLAVRLTDDVRVGLASVALLAVTPIHATRTGLGFADHHAFDYVFVAVVAYCLVALATRSEWDGRTAGYVAALAAGVTVQALAWDASPLLLAPVAVYLAVRPPSDLRADVPPLRANLPVLVGLGGAAVLTALVHLTLGWQRPFVAYTPLLLFLGGAAVLAAATAVERRGGDALTLATVEGGLAVGGLLGLLAIPVFREPLERGFAYFATTGGIAETRSLFAQSLGGVIAPIFWFGFGLFLALPLMGYATVAVFREHDPEWLPPLCYAWYFLAASVLQIRFGGSLALFVAVFGGLGFVCTAAWVELTRWPPGFGEAGGEGPVETVERPDRRNVLRLAGLGLGAGGLGALLTPIQHDQLTVSGPRYEAARWMRSYADRKGWEYPESYVFSAWGQNLFFNYFVNGRSDSYVFAQDNYGEFLESTDGEEWFERLHGRDGFVVTQDEDLSGAMERPEETLYHRLHERYGSDTGHYRALWAASDEAVKVFSVVPGVTVTGPGDPGSSFDVSESVHVGGGSVPYRQSVEVNDYGVFETTLAHPGTYSVLDSEIQVSEAAIRERRRRSLFDGDGIATWTFDEGAGDTAYDRVGGYHATLHGDVKWTDGEDGSALRFGESAYMETRLPPTETFTFSVWMRPERFGNRRVVVSSRNGAVLVTPAEGVLEFRLPGVDDDYWSFGAIEAGRWAHVAISYDGTRRMGYVDGEHRGSDRVSSVQPNWGDWLRFGGKNDRHEGFVGAFDTVQIYDRALGLEEVQALSERSS